MNTSILFYFLFSREFLLVDPTDKEETIMDGRMIMAMNIHREICGAVMGGGVSLESDQVFFLLFYFVSNRNTLREILMYLIVFQLQFFSEYLLGRHCGLKELEIYCPWLTYQLDFLGGWISRFFYLVFTVGCFGVIKNFVLKLGHIRINNINKKLKILYNVYQQ